MHVVDRVVGDRHAPGRGMHRGARASPCPLSSASATVKGLSVEPGSNRSVITRLRSCAPVRRARLFGLNDGHVGEREDLAGAHVDRRPARRPWRGARSTAALSALKARLWILPSIESVRSAPSCAGADRLDVLDDAAEAVLDDAPAAGLAAEGGLVGELDALLAGVVDAGEADHVSGHFAARVVAPVFALLVDALQAERRDRVGGLGRHLALQVDEVARRVGELLVDLLRPRIASSAASFCFWPGAELDVARNRPDRLHRRRHRERVAVAIEDAAARRRHLDARANSARRPSPAGSRCAAPAGRASGRRAPRSRRAAPISTKRARHTGRRTRPALRLPGRVHRAASPADDAHAARVGRAQAERARGDALDARSAAPRCSPRAAAGRTRRRARARGPARARARENSLRARCCEVTSPIAQATRTARRRRFSFATARRARFECWVRKAPRCARPPGGWRCARADLLVGLFRGCRTARPTSLERPVVAFRWHAAANRRGTSGRAACCRKRLTMRSSSEWKLITARRPPRREPLRPPAAASATLPQAPD